MEPMHEQGAGWDRSDRGQPMLTALGTRRARLLASAVVIATLTTGCFVGASSPSAGPPAGGITRQLFDLTNADRAGQGLPALQWDSQLGGLAQGWSEHMGSTGNFAHRNLNEVLSRPDYSRFQRLGENILVGTCSTSAGEIQRTWMNSPAHRANILGSYTMIGIGAVCTNGRLWVTQNFGR